MRMVSSAALDILRLRTCSIGAFKVPVAEYLRDLQAPVFKIFGTGFLVGPLTVMTNRHVLRALNAFAAKEAAPDDRRYVAFLRPHGLEMATTFYEIHKMGMTIEPRPVDVGLISLRASENDPLRSISPVCFSSDFTTSVGDAVAVYGYAAGENLLKREVGENEQIYRSGPILQHGYISAIAPFDHSTVIARLLLDVRTARGMSGSPVFDPETGTVLAIHEAGMGDTVAFGIPLISKVVAQLLTIHGSGEPGHNEGKISTVLKGDLGAADEPS